MKEFRLETYEITKNEVCCSYETMAYFANKFPEDEFYFIIGADSLFAIETWVHPELLFPNCILLAERTRSQVVQVIGKKIVLYTLLLLLESIRTLILLT